ncbi:MAG: ATP synthase F1 subunit gamma [Flavobacteriales bacterium TMED288]|nr:ATP synthase F1 subunit gamma [Flavobacteriales bacterium]RPG53009.1 MAG: ATP synthase F1 subunit gamma [Flavobacteriales bacterium TMED288]|tara:strand:+ start:583 stop:1443 length:861 start_codon:yes stop_codon:yes gene_type:complete
MANLKEIRTRINSVSSTMQITSAMKMVSAAKFKKAQNAIAQIKPYTAKLDELVKIISFTQINEEVENPFNLNTQAKNLLIVPISSNRGLCGAFNNNIFKRTEKELLKYSKNDVKVFPVGKKSYEYFNSRYEILQYNYAIFDNLNFTNSKNISSELLNLFLTKKFDAIKLIYNEFKNAATQNIKVENFLPIKIETEKNIESKNYIFEPTIENLIKNIIPNALKIQFYKSLLDSFASEHGARMTAMHKATDNAKQLKDELKLNYNRKRQAAITNEILEIVGGAEALKS